MKKIMISTNDGAPDIIISWKDFAETLGLSISETKNNLDCLQSHGLITYKELSGKKTKKVK